MAVRIKFNNDGLNALNEVFSDQKEFGPFVKGSDPNDLMLALKLMEKGTENIEKLVGVATLPPSFLPSRKLPF